MSKSLTTTLNKAGAELQSQLAEDISNKLLNIVIAHEELLDAYDEQAKLHPPHIAMALAEAQVDSGEPS